MTIAAVAVNDPVGEPTTNQLIANVNSSPYRQIFTSNGTWQVPAGCHKFKVTLCGGGGGSGPAFYNAPTDSWILGNSGGVSPMVSALFSGADVGTTFVVTVGAGGAVLGSGGTSSFGPTLSSTGGGPGADYTVGSNGAATLPGGAAAMYHDNKAFVIGYSGPYPIGYGEPGSNENPGRQGIVVVEF